MSVGSRGAILWQSRLRDRIETEANRMAAAALAIEHAANDPLMNRERQAPQKSSAAPPVALHSE